MKRVQGSRSGMCINLGLVGSYGKDGPLVWKIKCDCGTEMLIKDQGYLLEHLKSCGCAVQNGVKKRRKKAIKNIKNKMKPGMKFGRWTILKFVSPLIRKNKGNDSIKDYIFLCRCSCGVEREVTYHNLKHNRSRSCGCLVLDLIQSRKSEKYLKKLKDLAQDKEIEKTKKM